MLIEVVKELDVLGLIELHLGFNDRRINGKGRLTRICPTEKLISYFRKANFSIFEINTHSNKETIILKDKEKDKDKDKKDPKYIEYKDTKETLRMRSFLKDYNQLLQDTHIDCCSLDRPYESRRDTKTKKIKKLVGVNQQNKFTERSFARGSWSLGGRFYGGWWQNISRELRQDIRINGERTIEIDYSGLHITLLYALKDISYFQEVGSDPYDIVIPQINDADKRRWLVKNLLLMAINAKTEKKAFSALRNKTYENNIKLSGVRLTNEFLGEVLQKIKKKHIIISDDLCSDAGVKLQFTDSKITEHILKYFMDMGIAVLSVHDSYIVPERLSDHLRDAMMDAWSEVLGIKPDESQEYLESLLRMATNVKQIGYVDELLDIDPKGHEEIIQIKKKQRESPRYLSSLKAFCEEKRDNNAKSP